MVKKDNHVVTKNDGGKKYGSTDITTGEEVWHSNKDDARKWNNTPPDGEIPDGAEVEESD